MGLIAIEIDRKEFVLLATFLVRQSSIPEPTFEVLGDDRLVRSFDCSNVSLGEIASDLAPVLTEKSISVPRPTADSVFVRI